MPWATTPRAPFPAELVELAVSRGYPADDAAACAWRLAAAYGGKPDELDVANVGDLFLQACSSQFAFLA